VVDVLDNLLMTDHEDSHELDYPPSLAYQTCPCFCLLPARGEIPSFMQKAVWEGWLAFDDFQ